MSRLSGDFLTPATISPEKTVVVKSEVYLLGVSMREDEMAQPLRPTVPPAALRLAHASACGGGGVTVEVMRTPPWVLALLPWAEEGSKAQIFLLCCHPPPGLSIRTEGATHGVKELSL